MCKPNSICEVKCNGCTCNSNKEVIHSCYECINSGYDDYVTYCTFNGKKISDELSNDYEECDSKICGQFRQRSCYKSSRSIDCGEENIPF